MQTPWSQACAPPLSTEPPAGLRPLRDDGKWEQKAWSQSRPPPLSAERLLIRKGYKKALIATERRIAEAVWHCLTTGQPYTELGSDYYDKRKPRNAIRSGLNRLRQAGCDIQTADDGTYTITLPQQAA